jgi:hypothetical protein
MRSVSSAGASLPASRGTNQIKAEHQVGKPSDVLFRSAQLRSSELSRNQQTSWRQMWVANSRKCLNQQLLEYQITASLGPHKYTSITTLQKNYLTVILQSKDPLVYTLFK